MHLSNVPTAVIVADLLELGAPVVGPHAARYQPSRGRQYRSMCNASDGTVHGDSAPRLSFEQGQAQFAGWSTVSSPLILGEQASERASERARSQPSPCLTSSDSNSCEIEHATADNAVLPPPPPAVRL
jgi:hypothetical protein